jgi:4-amino-4-deoxy-L-arabinose transferase-like glycosyltransferase
LGDDPTSVKIVQAFADSLTVVVVYFVMREIFDIEVGLLSAGLFGLYPFLVYLTTSIASEPLFTLFLSGFVLSSLYAVRSDKAWHYCACGVLLGLATLTRATTQFVPFIFPLMLLLVRKASWKVLFGYAAFCFSFSLIVLPWTVRNYMVLDDFIPVATGGGIVVLMGSSERFLVIDGKPDMWRTHIPPQSSKPSERDKFFSRAGLELHKMHLQTDPLGFAAFMARKFFRLWYATESGSNHYPILLSHLPVYIFALAGLILTWKRRKSLSWIPVCIVSYFAALHWVSLPLFRYMIPTMPYLIGFASFAVITLANEWLARKKRISILSH